MSKDFLETHQPDQVSHTGKHHNVNPTVIAAALKKQNPAAFNSEPSGDIDPADISDAGATLKPTDEARTQSEGGQESRRPGSKEARK